MSSKPTFISPACAGPVAAQAQVSSTPIEKRREPRLTTHQTAQILWTDDLGDPHEEQVTITNVSMSGLAFLTHAAFRPGYELTLRAGSDSLECVVRHVERRDGRRFVGVEILTRAAGEDRRDLDRLAQALRDS